MSVSRETIYTWIYATREGSSSVPGLYYAAAMSSGNPAAALA
jgi:hypothetical protein